MIFSKIMIIGNFFWNWEIGICVLYRYRGVMKNTKFVKARENVGAGRKMKRRN